MKVIKRYSATKLSNTSGEFLDSILEGPVILTRNGKDHGIAMSKNQLMQLNLTLNELVSSLSKKDFSCKNIEKIKEKINLYNEMYENLVNDIE